jgi:HEPN domain-containing protein
VVEDSRTEAGRWLQHADEDLRAMRAVLADPDSPKRIACFLSHLAVEKALKATLVSAEIAFRKTHDLVALYELGRAAGRSPELDQTALAELTQWSVEGRYADDVGDAGAELAERLASFAQAAVSAIREELQSPTGEG